MVTTLASPTAHYDQCIWFEMHLSATGIVQGQASVVHVEERDNFRRIRIQFPAGKVDSVQIGASVAVNGTCLTVRKFCKSATTM